MTVRVRTISPRLRPVEPGAQISSNRRAGWWQFLCLRKGTRARRLTGAIPLEDDSCGSLWVHQIACLPLVGERAAEQVIEKQAAESLDRLLGERGQQA